MKTTLLFLIIFIHFNIFSDNCVINETDFSDIYSQSINIKKKYRAKFIIDEIKRNPCKLTGSQYSKLEFIIKKKDRGFFYEFYQKDRIKKSSLEELAHIVNGYRDLSFSTSNCLIQYLNYSFNISEVLIEWVYERESYYPECTKSTYCPSTNTTVITSTHSRLPSYRYYNYINIEGFTNNDEDLDINITFHYNDYFDAFILYHALKEIQYRKC